MRALPDSRSDWTRCAEALLKGVPFGHPDSYRIVADCQRLPEDLRAPVMVRALALRFAVAAGLTREQFEVCIFGPTTQRWSDPSQLAS